MVPARRCPTRRRRPGWLLLLILSFLAACSRPVPGTDGSVLDPQVADGPATALEQEAGDPAPADAVASRSPATGRPSGTSDPSNSLTPDPVGDGDDVGSGPTTDTPDDSGSAAPQTSAAGPGVDGRTIRIAFHGHFEDCPNQDNQPSDEAREKGRFVIDEYVRFFNEFVLKDHGWRFEHTIVDDGGYFCPERQRAAALQITKEIEPFAALGLSASAQGPLVADVITRAGMVHVGGSWQRQEEEAARHPYAWNVVSTSEKSLRFLVSWMERRIKGTPVPDRSTPANAEVDRVYGILGLDESLGRELAHLTRDEMRDAGMDVAGVYLASYDPGVTAQQAPTMVAKMRQDGVNTLVWAATIQGSGYYIALTETMAAQNYFPDIVTDWGNAFFAQLGNKRVWENAMGTTAYSIPALRVELDAQGNTPELNENMDGFIAAWHEKLGHSDSPQDGAYPGGYATWGQLSLLATGVLHAGDVLNAQTFAEGLESASRPGAPNRCTVARFMGRDYKHAQSFEWDAEHDGGAEGFTTMYWVNESRPPYTSGYYESHDNYVYFASPQDIPARPSHDTGERGADVRPQEKIGIRPWTPCSQFPASEF